MAESLFYWVIFAENTVAESFVTLVVFVENTVTESFVILVIFVENTFAEGFLHWLYLLKTPKLISCSKNFIGQLTAYLQIVEDPLVNLAC